MSKYSAKQVSTLIISTAIMLMLFGIFVLVYDNSKQDRVTYIVDEINNCTWERGVITESTEAFGELRTIEVQRAEEQSFLANAAADGECIVRLGDVAGSYATQLNRQYDAQVSR